MSQFDEWVCTHTSAGMETNTIKNSSPLVPTNQRIQPETGVTARFWKLMSHG